MEVCVIDHDENDNDKHFDGANDDDDDDENCSIKAQTFVMEGSRPITGQQPANIVQILQ